MAKTLTPTQIARKAWDAQDAKCWELAWQVGRDDPEFRAAQDEADRLWQVLRQVKADEKAAKVAKATREFHLRNQFSQERDYH